MEGRQFDEAKRIYKIDTLKRFIYGGAGKIDLVAPTGKSHTYAFEIPKDDEFPPGCRFVYAIHENKKFYIGIVENDIFRLTKHSKFNKDTEIVSGAYYILKLINSPNIKHLVNVKMKLYHYGTCARCGRPLNPSLWEYGIGKKCDKKYIEMRRKECGSQLI